jgi:hypothetical protein
MKNLFKNLPSFFKGEKKERKYITYTEIEHKKDKQMHSILKVLLQRSGQQVSVFDITRKSNALNHTARITNLRHRLFNMARKPKDIDFTKDIIRNIKSVGVDADGDKCIISTYVLMPDFRQYAIELEQKMRENAIKDR